MTPRTLARGVQSRIHTIEVVLTLEAGLRAKCIQPEIIHQSLAKMSEPNTSMSFKVIST